MLCYVKSSLEYSFMYKINNCMESDTNEYRSQSDYCSCVGSTMISWCQKQSTVAISSTRVEYVVATIATQKYILLKYLIGDIYSKVNYEVPIESVIRLALNSIFYEGIKHAKIHHHFVQEKVLNQEVELKRVLVSMH